MLYLCCNAVLDLLMLRNIRNIKTIIIIIIIIILVVVIVLINQSINQSIYIAQRHNVSNALKRGVNTERIKTFLNNV